MVVAWLVNIEVVIPNLSRKHPGCGNIAVIIASRKILVVVVVSRGVIVVGMIAVVVVE